MLERDAYVCCLMLRMQAGLAPQCDGLVQFFSVLALDFIGFLCVFCWLVGAALLTSFGAVSWPDGKCR